MRHLRAPASAAAALALFVCAGCAPDPGAARSFEADLLWPQPLGNAWILGSVTGVAVDGQDQVWVVHRGDPSMTARTEIGLGTDPPTAETCCRSAPQVLAFDQAGNLVASWEGAGQDGWPQTPGGIAVDADGNVWITAASAAIGASQGRGGRGGRGGGREGGPAPEPPPADAHVLKFSPSGALLLQIGLPGEVGDAESQTTLNRPAGVDFDASANEVYVADTGNSRIVVFDAGTGAYKRHWGANVDAFRGLSCVTVAGDGLVYACDRLANRIQVFRADGTFVTEVTVGEGTLGNGAVWDIALSSDSGQANLYVADGQNQKVWVLDRETLAVTGDVGAGGRWPGHFYAVGSVAVDSQGNLYTGETLEGKRVQKFVAER
jgi:DNA-binding beta-propeller fold protein YncE